MQFGGENFDRKGLTLSVLKPPLFKKSMSETVVGCALSLSPWGVFTGFKKP